MAKKKPRVDDSFVLFDVIYEDGRKSSRRRVAAAELPDTESDAHAKTIIMTQDRAIAAMSGQERGAIRSITKSPG